MQAWKALAVLRSRLRQSVNFEGFFTNHKSIFTIFCKVAKTSDYQLEKTSLELAAIL